MNDSRARPEAEGRGHAAYEAPGVHIAGVWWFAIGLAVSTALILAGIWWGQLRWAPGTPPQLESLHVDQPLQPSPGHQTLPWEDLVALRAAQERELQAYGPVDDSHARIPIERAMDLLLQSGTLQQPWKTPTLPPYQTETQPYAKPTVRNRT